MKIPGVTNKSVRELIESGKFKLEGFQATVFDDDDIDFRRGPCLVAWVTCRDVLHAISGQEGDAEKVEAYLRRVLSTEIGATGGTLGDSKSGSVENPECEEMEIKRSETDRGDKLQTELTAALAKIKTLKSDLAEANHGWTEAEGKVLVYERLLPGGFTNLSK